jgi:DNA-binding transcriptional ArsR family regulator
LISNNEIDIRTSYRCRTRQEVSVIVSTMTAKPARTATVEELRALGHPVRWRILRLCVDEALTNQQLAHRIEGSPATTLRHVRALVEAGFLAAEPVRTGERGALERPYRATGRTWGLVVDAEAGPTGLGQQVELAVLAAHRAEMIDAGPDATRDAGRGLLRLRPDSAQELRVRLTALLAEFAARDEPGGERLSYLWSLVARPPGPAGRPDCPGGDTHGARPDGE